MAPRNPLPNPSLANDLTGHLTNVGTPERLTGLPATWDRPTAARVTVPSSAPSYTEHRFAPTAAAAADLGGTTWSGTVQWSCDTSGGNVNLFIIFLTAAGGIPSGTYYTTKTIASTNYTPGTVYRTALTPGVAPAGTYRVSVWVRQNAAPATAKITTSAARVDQVNDPALPYADAATPGWAADTNAGGALQLVQASTALVSGSTVGAAPSTPVPAAPVDYAGASGLISGSTVVAGAGVNLAAAAAIASGAVVGPTAQLGVAAAAGLVSGSTVGGTGLGETPAVAGLVSGSRVTAGAFVEAAASAAVVSGTTVAAAAGFTAAVAGSVVSGTRVTAATPTTTTGDIAGLTASFSTGAVPPPGWATAYGVTVVGGRGRILATNAGTGATTYSGLKSSDQAGGARSWSSLAHEVTAVPSAGGANPAPAMVWIYSASQPGSTRIGWEYDSNAGTLSAKYQVNYGDAAAVAIAYDPTAHRWWRVRNTAGTITWETSPTGLAGSWTTQRSLAAPAWTQGSDLSVSFEAYRTTGTSDFFEIDNVNLLPAATFQASTGLVSGTVVTASPRRAAAVPSSPAVGADALQRRTLTEIRLWADWLARASASGYVGEFAAVTLYPNTTGVASWAALLEVYLGELDRLGISGTAWASGREWGSGYPLGVHVGPAVGDPLSISNTIAGNVGAHPSRGDGTRHGVNLSGWESGISTSGGGTVRSTAGYVHTAADLAYVAAAGIDTVRLPIAWERLQPTLSGALDATALTSLDTMLTAARANGVAVILDLHNYGRFTEADGTVRLLGGTLTAAQLADFWTRMVAWLRADAARSSSVVALDLMNEPHDLPGGSGTWEQASQAVLTAIRQAGETRLLFVAGYAWSSLTNWSTTHPTGWISDPAQAFAYEAHHYWDTQSALGNRSGTYQQAKAGGGVEVETYATELAAAAAQTAASAQLASGTRVAGTVTLTAAAAAGVVSGSRVGAGGVGVYDAGPAAITAGTRVTAAADRATTAAAAITSGSRVAIAPSLPAAGGSTSGTRVTADPTVQGSTSARVVSGSQLFSSDSYVLPAAASAVRSGSVVTAAPLLDAAAAAAVTSGTRAGGDAVRTTATSVGVVSGTQVGAAAVAGQALGGLIVSGTRVAAAAPAVGSTLTGRIVSGALVGVTPLDVNVLASGSVVRAAPTQTAVAIARLTSGSVVAVAFPTALTAAGGRLVSGTVVAPAPATTVGFVAARALVSGSRVGARGDTVKIGVATILSGTTVVAALWRTQRVRAQLVSGSFVQANAAQPYRPRFLIPDGPVRLQVPNPVTRVLLCETRTGRVHSELPYSTLQWSSPLNKIGAGRFTVPVRTTREQMGWLDVLDAAPGVIDPRAELRAMLTGGWRFSTVVAFGETAVWGGPMLPTDDEDDSTVTVGAVQMERMLEKRVAVNRAGTGGWADPSRDLTLTGSTVRYAAYYLVSQALDTSDGRPRGLPITCSSVPPSKGDENFTWLSYDVQRTWKALTDLQQRPDGPDVRLEPFLYTGADGALYAAWDLQIGGPTFDVDQGVVGPQGPTPWTWSDSTCRIRRTVDPANMATTTYTTGTGQDRDKLISRYQTSDLTALGWPELEEVDTGTATQDDVGQLNLRAQALGEAHARPVDSWQVSAAAVDEGPQLGTFRRGDSAQLEVSNKVLIPPGVYRRRITEVASDGPRRVTVSCDYEDGLEVVG